MTSFLVNINVVVRLIAVVCVVVGQLNPTFMVSYRRN